MLEKWAQVIHQPEAGDTVYPHPHRQVQNCCWEKNSLTTWEIQGLKQAKSHRNTTIDVKMWGSAVSESCDEMFPKSLLSGIMTA